MNEILTFTKQKCKSRPLYNQGYVWMIESASYEDEYRTRQVAWFWPIGPTANWKKITLEGDSQVLVSIVNCWGMSVVQ